LVKRRNAREAAPNAAAPSTPEERARPHRVHGVDDHGARAAAADRGGREQRGDAEEERKYAGILATATIALPFRSGAIRSPHERWPRRKSFISMAQRLANVLRSQVLP
jgi:hypothetical protein